eukprot:2068439-Pleurochrysis_carterae.AAC.6
MKLERAAQRWAVARCARITQHCGAHQHELLPRQSAAAGARAVVAAVASIDAGHDAGAELAEHAAVVIARLADHERDLGKQIEHAKRIRNCGL